MTKLKFRFSRKAFAYPYMIFLLLFVVVPLVIVLINAFLGDDGKLTFANFAEFFSDKGGGLTVLGIRSLSALLQRLYVLLSDTRALTFLPSTTRATRCLYCCYIAYVG